MIQISEAGVAVAIDPEFGNNAFSMTVRGREILWTPPDWRKPALGGIPLLAPWANRLDGDWYLANGNRYILNDGLNNLRRDVRHQPIHGLLLFATGWKVVHQDAASVTSRLEFWRFPQWMAQFPFAHAIEMTHRLHDGELEVETLIENMAIEPMPLCIGYHPYFQFPESSTLHIAARQQVELSDKVLPTSGRKPVIQSGPPLDAVFVDLTGEPFTMQAPDYRLEVRFGPKYPVAIVYSPANARFVCFEPMTALTNAFNSGDALQQIAPGETWRASFFVRVVK